MTLASNNINKDLTQHQVLCNLLKEKKKLESISVAE